MPELTQYEKMSQRMTGKCENLARRWKGDDVGYVATHTWLRKKFGNAIKCENPSCQYPKPKKYRKPILQPKRFEWASISRKNLRDVNDYVQLCPSCHRKYDIKKLTLKQLYEQDY